jgi:spectinomycin phosphotransferase
MRTEPDLDQSRLLELLRDRYRLEVELLTFVPYGTDSWGYVATRIDSRRAFVKLARWDPEKGATASGIPLMVALAARHVPVPRPIADRDGGFLNALDGYEVQVFEYLDGRSLEDETAWPDDLYARVAVTVASVHASTRAVRHLVERLERFELPFLSPFIETLAIVEAGAALPAGDDPTLASLRVMLIPRVRELRIAIDRLEELRDLAMARDSDEVLCHTDIWGSNLLRSGDGTLHLLDWNGALVGPPEHDLFMFAGTDFFPADRFGWFLERYQAAFRPVRLGAETFGFYFYRRNLEDLALFVESIAVGGSDAMGPTEALRVIANLLAELPRIEDRIAHVASVLRQARSGPP